MNRHLLPSEVDVPPEKWIFHKLEEELESMNHVLRVPIRDDGKPYSIVPEDQKRDHAGCDRQNKGVDVLYRSQQLQTPSS
jgi:hypothetical protein